MPGRGGSSTATRSAPVRSSGFARGGWGPLVRLRGLNAGNFMRVTTALMMTFRRGLQCRHDRPGNMGLRPRGGEAGGGRVAGVAATLPLPEPGCIVCEVVPMPYEAFCRFERRFEVRYAELEPACRNQE